MLGKMRDALQGGRGKEPAADTTQEHESGSAEGPAGLKRENVVVAGIQADVFSRSRAHGPAGAEVAVMFLLHGRGGAARKMEVYVEGLFEELASVGGGGASRRELVIVTFVSARVVCAGLDVGVELTRAVVGPAEPWEALGR